MINEGCGNQCNQSFYLRITSWIFCPGACVRQNAPPLKKIPHLIYPLFLAARLRYKLLALSKYYLFLGPNP